MLLVSWTTPLLLQHTSRRTRDPSQSRASGMMAAMVHPACGSATPTVLLLGMGNPILRDDAVGIRLARQLQQRLGERPGLTVVPECSVGGINLLEVIGGFDRVIVLDSIKTGQEPAGSWYRFSARSLRETLHLSSVHDANFMTALELGRLLGMALPVDDEIHIFAVEVDDNITFDERMTDALESAFDHIVQEIGAEVALLIG